MLNPSFVGVFAPKHAPGTVPVVVTNPGAPASAPLSFTYTCESGGGEAHHCHEHDDDDGEDGSPE